LPNIQEFDAGNLSLRPTEVGPEARAGTARRIGMFSNQEAGAEEMLARETERLAGETSRLGSETGALGAEKGAALADTGRRVGSSIADAGDVAVKYLDHQQISQGAPAFARLMEQKTKEWNDTVTNADPNDPTVARKFLDNLEPDLTKFKEQGFYTEAGQNWAEAHIDALRQHMTETTQADMANKAKQATDVNLQQMSNSLSSNVYNDPSKSNLDFSLAAMRSGLEGMISANPNLNAAQVGQVRSELQQTNTQALIKSNAIGYIAKTGQLPPWINDPKYAPYINGAELKMFEKAAQAQGKVNAYYDKQNELTAKQLADLKVHQAATKVQTDNITYDPQTGRPIIDPKFFPQSGDIARNNPDAPHAAETMRTMLSWGGSQQIRGAKPEDDPTTTNDLTDRMFSPDHPTTVLDLMKAHDAGKISDHTFQVKSELVKELEQSPLKGPVWQDTVAAVKDELILSNVGLSGKDITGAANYSKWAQMFIPQYLAKSRAGTLPPNALDVKDPNSMISQSMAPFHRTVQQRAQDYLSVLKGFSPDSATPAPAARMMGNVPVPTALRGIAALQYSSTTKQWRDQTSHKIYNAEGAEVAQ
jgi:hypothetical protein